MNENMIIRNENEARYLLIKVHTEEDGTDYDSMGLGMLSAISGENLLKPQIIYKKSDIYLRYEITDLRSLKEYFSEKRLAYEDITEFMIQLNNAAHILREFLLSENELLLDEDTIFIDRKDGRFIFCASTDEDGRKNIFEALMKSLLLAADIPDDRAIILSAKLFKESLKPDCRIYDLMNTISEDRMHASGSKRMSGSERIHNAKKEQLDDWLKTEKESAESSTDNGNDGYRTWFKETEREDLLYNAGDTYKSPYSIKEIDDLDIDSDIDYENGRYTESLLKENEDGAHTAVEGDISDKKDKHKKNALIPKLAAAQFIMLAGLIVVYLLRGMSTVVKCLPIYAILAVCTALYIIIGWLADNRKKASAE